MPEVKPPLSAPKGGGVPHTQHNDPEPETYLLTAMSACLQMTPSDGRFSPKLPVQKAHRLHAKKRKSRVSFSPSRKKKKSTAFSQYELWHKHLLHSALHADPLLNALPARCLARPSTSPARRRARCCPPCTPGQLHAYRLRIRLPPGGCTLRALSSCKLWVVVGTGR